MAIATAPLGERRSGVDSFGLKTGQAAGQISTTLSSTHERSSPPPSPMFNARKQTWEFRLGHLVGYGIVLFVTEPFVPAGTPGAVMIRIS